MRKIVFCFGLFMSTTSLFAQWTGSNPISLTDNAYINGKLGIGSTVMPRSFNIFKTHVGLPAFGAALESYTTGFRITHNWAGTSGGPYTPHQYDFSADASKFYLTYFNTGLPSAGTSLMVVTKEGKVGIGTQSPNARLHVADDGTTALDAHLEGFTLIDGYESSLLFGRQTGAAYGEWGIEYNNVAGGLNFWKPAGGTTGYAGTNYHIFIKNDGKVGINTNNPTARLTVNGNVLIGDPATISIPNANYKLFVETGILTEKVKVALETTADWADYVFQKDYQLMPLKQVENYIDLNGHLPGVPSAEEVKENGIDVAKMDAKLLEKIEELTIYVIELKKENEAIKAELEQLKNK